MRLLETTAAARCGRVLRDESRMVPPRRLAPVVRDHLREQSFPEQVIGLLHDVGQAPGLQIGQLAALQAELATERRSREAAEGFVDVDHRVATMKRPISVRFV